MKQLPKMLLKHLKTKPMTDKSNNSDKSNNINGKNNSNTTSNVPKDSNKTDVSIKRATGNPLFALLAVLLMLSVSRIRKFKK